MVDRILQSVAPNPQGPLPQLSGVGLTARREANNFLQAGVGQLKEALAINQRQNFDTWIRAQELNATRDWIKRSAELEQEATGSAEGHSDNITAEFADYRASLLANAPSDYARDELSAALDTIELRAYGRGVAFETDRALEYRATLINDASSAGVQSVYADPNSLPFVLDAFNSVLGDSGLSPANAQKLRYAFEEEVWGASFERLLETNTTAAEQLLNNPALIEAVGPDRYGRYVERLDQRRRDLLVADAVAGFQSGNAVEAIVDAENAATPGGPNYNYFTEAYAAHGDITPEEAIAAAVSVEELEASGVSLSKHYTLDELTGGHEGRPIFLHPDALRGLDQMVDILTYQPTIFSAFREDIGSDRHQEGYAFDFSIAGLSDDQIYDMVWAARVAGATSLGIYPGHIHIDWKPTEYYSPGQGDIWAGGGLEAVPEYIAMIWDTATAAIPTDATSSETPAATPDYSEMIPETLPGGLTYDSLGMPPKPIGMTEYISGLADSGLYQLDDLNDIRRDLNEATRLQRDQLNADQSEHDTRMNLIFDGQDVSDRPSLQEMTDLYGPQNAWDLEAQYRIVETIGEEIRQIRNRSPEENRSIIEAYEAQISDDSLSIEDRELNQNALALYQEAFNAHNQQLASSPHAYLIQNDERAQALWQGYVDAASSPEISNDWSLLQNYVRYSVEKQREAGVSDDDLKPLSDAMALSIAQTIDGSQSLGLMILSMRSQMVGDRFDPETGQMTPSGNQEFLMMMDQIAPLTAFGDDLTFLARYAGDPTAFSVLQRGVGVNTQGQRGSDWNELQEALTGLFAPFRQAFATGSPDNLDAGNLDSMQNLMERAGLAFMQAGYDPTAAAEHVFEAAIGSKYTVMVDESFGDVRIQAFGPAGLDPEVVATNLELLMRTDRIREWGGLLYPQGQTNIAGYEIQAQMLAQRSTWITNAESTGLVLAVPTSPDGSGPLVPVVNEAGETYELLFSQIVDIPNDPLQSSSGDLEFLFGETASDSFDGSFVFDSLEAGQAERFSEMFRGLANAGMAAFPPALSYDMDAGDLRATFGVHWPAVAEMRRYAREILESGDDLPEGFASAMMSLQLLLMDRVHKGQGNDYLIEFETSPSGRYTEADEYMGIQRFMNVPERINAPE